MFEPVRDEFPPRRASRWLCATGSIALLAGLAISSGCVRDAQPCIVEMNEGDLVITELRGPQDGTIGEWIELYNASGEVLDLRGLRGTLRPLKGSEVDGDLDLTFLVRESLPVEANAYVVLGTLPLDASRRPDVDYSINSDFRLEPEVVDITGGVVVLPEDENADPRSLFGSGRLRIYACERLIDSFAYAELPALGTLSYDGNLVPDADDNDDITHWCPDESEQPTDGPQTATGLPGSAGAANRPCP